MATNDKFSAGDIARSMPKQDEIIEKALASRAQNSSKTVTPSQLKNMLPEHNSAVSKNEPSTKPLKEDRSVKNQSSTPPVKEAAVSENTKLTMPSELTPNQQKEWNQRMNEAPETVTPSELKNNLQQTVAPQQSDKLQIVSAVAASYIAKNVPAEQQEAVTKAIAQQAAALEKNNSLPSATIHDQNAPSQSISEKAHPAIEREQDSERNR